MRRLVALFSVLSLASMTLVAAAQSLGEVAEKTKKERKGKEGKVFTNEDLGPERSPAPPPAPATGAATPTPPPASTATTMDPSQRWRRDAQNARDAIARAQTKVDMLQARVNAMLLDMSPSNVGDPNRLQNLERDKAAALAELETAKGELAQARQAQEDLEEKARKAGVPPGWLREP